MIRTLKQGEEDGHFAVSALLTQEEYAELQGRLDDLRVFAATLIDEPASTIKTGARHSYAKYLLFPVKLRRRWRTDQFDFEKLRCGVLNHEGTLYVIYAVPGKPGPR